MGFNVALFQVNHLFDLIRDRLVANLGQTTWMRGHLREAAKDKVARIRGEFVGADFYSNYTFLQTRYEGVSTHYLQKITKRLCIFTFNTLFLVLQL